MIFLSREDSELCPTVADNVARRHSVEYLSGEPMSIRAIYENGVLKPLEKLLIKEGTEVTVDVYPIEGQKESSGKRKSVKDFAAYGMWKDRTDFKDGVG